MQRLTWIMASRLGRCPSRAPEKHSLGDRDGWGLGAQPWISAQDLLSLWLSSLTPCSRPQQPTGPFFPTSRLPPSCFWFLSWDQIFVNGVFIVPASGGPHLQGFSSSGPQHCVRARAPTLPQRDHPFPSPGTWRR